MENQKFEPLFTFISKENNSLKYKCNICSYFICPPSKSNVKFEQFLKHHISKYHSEAVEQYQNTVKNNEIMAANTLLLEQNTSVHEQDIDENKSFQAPKLDNEKSTIVPGLKIIVPPIYVDNQGRLTHKKEKSNDPESSNKSLKNADNENAQVRAVRRSENLGMPVSTGANLVNTGLTDMPKYGGAMTPPALPVISTLRKNKPSVASRWNGVGTSAERRSEEALTK